MAVIPVVFESWKEETPKHGYWDYNLIEKMIAGKVWNPANGFRFKEYEHIIDVPKKQDGIVLVFPSRYFIEDVDMINEQISRFKWVVVLAINDEEGIFPAEKLKHPNMKLWQMTPRTGKQAPNAMPIGEGPPPDSYMLKDFAKEALERPIDFYFSGQITTARRREMKEQLELVKGDYKTILNYTNSFTAGFEHEEYYRNFALSKLAICPTGAVTPDSFRLYEALEAGCYPIADDISSVYKSEGFFDMLYGSTIFTTIRKYDDMPGYIKDALQAWPKNANRTYAWWQGQKRNLTYKLHEDIEAVSGKYVNGQALKDNITVIIPVSPIKSHPNTSLLEETIQSVRTHLPECEIIVTFDGVRKEQEDRRANYEEFIRRILWKFNFEYSNVYPIIFDEHMHQTGMMREILPMIKTETLLYVESDTPLTPDNSIEWDACLQTILEGELDVVRFHFEAHIPKEHEYLMLGVENFNGVNFMRTAQWSQRPHLASVAFYDRILRNEFSEHANSFIEDKMHGVAANAFIEHGLLGWQSYRLGIYFPDGHIKRSYHSDGRGGEAKYDDKQVF